MIKALWLTSWYPNELEKSNGDFVQRHAQAVSLYCKVDVIHLEADVKKLLKEQVVITKTSKKNLTENIVLYKLNVLPVIGRFISLQRYRQLFKKQIRGYIKENGLPDIVHVQIPIKAGLLALWFKKKYNIPYLVTEQWAIYNTTAPDAFNKRNHIFKIYSKKIYSNADLFLPVSKELGEAVNKTVTPVNYKVAENAVNTKLFYADIDNSNSGDKPFIFVHVSTMSYQKNAETILDAFILFQQSHTNCKLLMVGETPESFSQYIKNNNLSIKNIEFTGYVEYKHVADHMRKSNAFILFSRYENMPCVVLEALCCGLPVITSNAGGVAEVINEQNGIVVIDYTKAALLKAMTTLYTSYNKYNKKFISSNAIEKFSFEKIGEAITDVYIEVLGNYSKH